MTQPPPHATVVQPGYPAHRRIVEAFGTEVLLENGNIDRKVLGDLIFNQPDRRHVLNTITHPEIRKEMMKETFKYFLRGKSQGLGQVRQSPPPLQKVWPGTEALAVLAAKFTLFLCTPHAEPCANPRGKVHMALSI